MFAPGMPSDGSDWPFSGRKKWQSLQREFKFETCYYFLRAWLDALQQRLSVPLPVRTAPLPVAPSLDIRLSTRQIIAAPNLQPSTVLLHQSGRFLGDELPGAWPLSVPSPAFSSKAEQAPLKSPRKPPGALRICACLRSKNTAHE